MRPRARTVVLALAVIGIEAWLYRRYAGFGGQFHFWLHGLFGGALGLLLVAAYRLTATTRLTPWGPGFIGHVYSAFPDFLFVFAGLVHVLWMDAFAFHVSLHFIPAPLLWMLGVFILALAGERAAAHGHRRPALLAIGIGVSAVALGLGLRTPLPETLEEIRSRSAITLVCPLSGTQEQRP